jgi:hypothetical protein
MAGCHLVYFLCEVCHKPKITKAVLAERTKDYQAWVEACARNHQFVSVGDSQALQRAADQLDGQTLQARIDYWALIVGPKFSPRERAACGGLHRVYAGQQLEYCRNFIFKRHWPIRAIFQRACELGLHLLTADRVAVLFGQQQRRKTSNGKWQNVLIGSRWRDCARHPSHTAGCGKPHVRWLNAAALPGRKV